MNEPTYKRVCRVIGELAGIDAEMISPGQSLGQTHSPNHYWQSLVINAEPPRPIGFDSLDLIQLAMGLEDEFAIQITDDEVDDRRLDHVGGLVAFVQGRLDAKLEFFNPRISDAAEPWAVSAPDLSLIKEALDRLNTGIRRIVGIDLSRPGAEL